MRFLTTLRASLSELIGSTSDQVKMMEHTRKMERAAAKQQASQPYFGERWWLQAALVVGALQTVGCGNSLYLVQVNRAERNFQEAKELDAERYAPYEYYSAKVRLEEARRQAAEAEYSNAADLSDEATDYSSKAIALSKEARKHATNTESNK